jgi:hypothetical protein
VSSATWAVASLLIALFLGGYVVSQCTVGESAGEAAIYGVVMWGVVVALLLWLPVTGVRLGFNAVMTMAATPAGQQSAADWREQAQSAGFKAETIEANREAFEKLGQNIRAAADDPRATQAAWWTFAGVLFSMLAAMAGAIAGSGPQVVIAGFPVRARFFRSQLRTTVPTRAGV